MLQDPKKTKDAIVQWIRDYFAENGPECAAVVGISGGKDSSIVAALCAEALGKDRVYGVMMPDGIQSDIADSHAVIASLGIYPVFIDVRPACKAIQNAVKTSLSNVSTQTKINIPPRIRMTMLYAFAQSLPTGGRIANTCNKSEEYVGYSTKFGDTAGDFSPLQNFLVEEVKQIGHVCKNLPPEFVDKVPSDGLCGLTDEDNFGFTYTQLDQFIQTGTSGDAEVDEKIKSLHQRNLHKLEPMPAAPNRITAKVDLCEIGVLNKNSTVWGAVLD